MCTSFHFHTQTAQVIFSHAPDLKLSGVSLVSLKPYLRPALCRSYSLAIRIPTIYISRSRSGDADVRGDISQLLFSQSDHPGLFLHHTWKQSDHQGMTSMGHVHRFYRYVGNRCHNNAGRQTVFWGWKNEGNFKTNESCFISSNVGVISPNGSNLFEPKTQRKILRCQVETLLFTLLFRKEPFKWLRWKMFE